MVDAALGRARLVAQGLVTRPFARPGDAVAAFGAMQGQDLPGALASASLRTACGHEAAIEDLDVGRLVRAYPMRGTLFLMAAEDAAWVSELCNPAILRAQEKRHHDYDLDDGTVGRARDRLLAALEGRQRGFSRAEVMAVWATDGLSTEGGRGYHVLSYLIGRGDVVFGPWNGTDQNVVAASTWLPRGSTLEGRFGGDRIAAVAELLQRYLTSHGPATVRDFAWWTKLPLKEIRAAWSLVEDDVDSDGDRIYRPGLYEEVAAAGKDVKAPLLLPGFDEFVLGYQDRLFAMSPDEHDILAPGNNGAFRRAIVVDGVVRGVWKRGGTKGRRQFELQPFGSLSAATQKRLVTAYEAFPFITP